MFGFAHNNFLSQYLFLCVPALCSESHKNCVSFQRLPIFSFPVLFLSVLLSLLLSNHTHLNFLRVNSTQLKHGLYVSKMFGFWWNSMLVLSTSRVCLFGASPEPAFFFFFPSNLEFS